MAFLNNIVIINIYMSDEIDQLLDEVNSLPDCMNDNYNQSLISPIAVPSISGNEQLNDFIVTKGVELIEIGLTAIREIQQSSAAAKTPEDVEAYSELIKSVSGALDSLNKINIQSMKSRSAKEIKQMDVESRSNAAKQLNDRPNQTNVLIATRDQFFKQLIEHIEAKPVIDVES